MLLFVNSNAYLVHKSSKKTGVTAEEDSSNRGEGQAAGGGGGCVSVQGEEKEAECSDTGQRGQWNFSRKEIALQSIRELNMLKATLLAKK